MAGSSSETTPLLGTGGVTQAQQVQPPMPQGVTKEQGKQSLTARISNLLGPANRILLAGFLMSFTLGITQVP